MRIKIMFSVLLIAATARFAGAQSVFVADEVLKTARWAHFEYKDVMAKVKKGDRHAVKRFLEFHRMLDGQECVLHAITCLELILPASDDEYAWGVSMLSPNMKKVVLERIIQAQGRTGKEKLRKKMAEWAPNTWLALNDLPFHVADKNADQKRAKQ